MKQLIRCVVLVTLMLTAGCTTTGDMTQEESSMEPISYNAELAGDFDAAIEKVTLALKEEGFGIISRIDMHTTFKEKIDKEIPPHTILGACNPNLAYQAVTAEPEASLMLPCNVTVQQEGDVIMVRIMNPDAMMTMAGFDSNPHLQAVGTEADIRLKRVAQSLIE